MKTKNIKQTVKFKAPPEEVYDLLMNQKKIEAFSGGEAKVSKKVGGSFTVFDGYCHGNNMELVPGKKIVQAWHFDEDGWPDDHYTECTFTLKEVPGGTQLTFTQTGIPEHKAEALAGGWKDYYWQPMKEFLKTK